MPGVPDSSDSGRGSSATNPPNSGGQDHVGASGDGYDGHQQTTTLIHASVSRIEGSLRAHQPVSWLASQGLNALSIVVAILLFIAGAVQTSSLTGQLAVLNGHVTAIHSLVRLIAQGVQRDVRVDEDRYRNESKGASRGKLEAEDASHP